MRTKRTTRDILDDDSSPATDRVMRAYWLAPRASRSATVIALTAADAALSASPHRIRTAIEPR